MALFYKAKVIKMNETPNYYAIIPANVRYNNSIQQGAKLLYGEITALSNKTGCCWAGDQYFMGLYKVSQATIQRWLTSLEKNGYIDRTVKYKDGSKEIEKRYIRINAYPILKNENTYTQKCEYPILKNEQENNTSINNINTRANSTLESDFEKLWKLYPKKIGKKAALAAYKRAMKRKKNPTTNKQIQDGIVAYKRIIANSGTDRQFIKDGSTFFNQEAWNDYLEVIREERDEHEARKPKFDPRKVAIMLYDQCSTFEEIVETIKHEGIPLNPEDAKRYIDEYKEERMNQ